MVHVSLTFTVGPACNRCTNILTYTAQYIHTYTVLYILYVPYDTVCVSVYILCMLYAVLFSMCTFVLCIAIKNVCVHAYSLCWRSVRS